MNEIKLLTEIEWVSLIIQLVCIAIAVEIITGLWNRLVTKLGLENKWSLKKKKESALIVEHGTKIADLDEKFEELSNKFDDFSSSSKAMDNTINESVNALRQMHLESQAKSDAAARARLKDKIGERYRDYHETGEWNKMEKEAFEDLIKDYEAHGGNNSFVHEICKVECYTWKLID